MSDTLEYIPPRGAPEMRIPMTPAEVKRMWGDRFQRGAKKAARNALRLATMGGWLAPTKFDCGTKKTGAELWDEFAEMNDRSGLVYEWTERTAAPDWNALVHLHKRGGEWPRRAVLEYDCQAENVEDAFLRALNKLAEEKRKAKAAKARAKAAP